MSHLLHNTNPLLPNNGSPIYYQGPDLKAGPLPAVIYFALSAQMSLFEDPFNQPAIHLSQQGVRVFSWNLPFHENGIDPHVAMHQWILELIHSPSSLVLFLERCQHHINYLIEEGFVDPQHLGVAGLSRGGFIAAHLAARDSRIKNVLGFAPLTDLTTLEESKPLSELSLDQMSLNSITEKLIHTRLHFYIGNHDTRVETKMCFHFIHHLATVAFQHGIRSPTAELHIYPSIGHKGHGTPPHIFREGAEWMKEQLLRND